MMKICCLSELDGSKIKRIQDFGQFQPFLVLWDPLVGPPGVFILVFHSQPLSLHQISVTITKMFYLSEMDGGKINKIQDFGQFWPFLYLQGPRGVPQEPPSLILEVYRILFFSLVSDGFEKSEISVFAPRIRKPVRAHLPARPVPTAEDALLLTHVALQGGRFPQLVNNIYQIVILQCSKDLCSKFERNRYFFTEITPIRSYEQIWL